MRRLAPLLLVLLAGCSHGTSPAPVGDDPLSPRPAVEPPAPSATVLPTCTGLTLQDADLLADEHQLQEVFALRTTGPACALRGWPEVQLLRADGTVIAVSTSRTGTDGPVTLDRTSSLSFLLGTPRSSSCEDVSSVVVRLPGTSAPLRAASTMQVCDGRLTVSPVQRRGDTD